MLSINTVSLNYNEQVGLRGIIEKTVKDYPIKQILLYGSKARGEFIEGSDIDLLFITEWNMSRPMKTKIGDIIYDYELANDIVVSAIFVSDSEFREKMSLFLMKVKKEGIVLWSRE